MTAIVTAHRRALDLAQPVLDAVRPEQLDLSTPCGDWTLGRLLAHVIGQNHGFADAARGHGDDRARWADREFGADPAGAFAASAEQLTAAFGEAVRESRPLLLPEILPGHAFPPAQAIGFHYLDTMIHGWDVAAAIGAPFDCPADLARLLLRIAEQVPATPEARGPGHAFGPVRESGRQDLTPFDRALTLLGRDPAWRA